MFFSGTNSASLLSLKTTMVLIIFLLIIFAFLGINVLKKMKAFFRFVYDLFTPMIYQIMSIMGYTTGTIINKTSHIVSNTTKNGIDIIDNSVSDIGNILKYAGKNGANIPIKTTIDNAETTIPTPVHKENFENGSSSQVKTAVRLLSEADNDIQKVLSDIQTIETTKIPIGSIANVGSSVPSSISGFASSGSSFASSGSAFASSGSAFASSGSAFASSGSAFAS